MSGRLRVLGVSLLMMGSLLAAGPAAAGGPTSVMLSVPGEGRMAALYTTDADYGRLADAVGAFGTAPAPAKGSHPSPGSPYVTLTWLIHDVSPWRVDRVHAAADGLWLATQTSTDGADIWAGSEVWSLPSNPKELDALLVRLGVHPAKGSVPAGTSVGASPGSAGFPASVADDAPAAETASAPESDAGTPGLLWAALGLVAGVALTLGGQQAWSRRRRRPAEPDEPDELVESVEPAADGSPEVDLGETAPVVRRRRDPLKTS
jgi:hypothetical protein